MINVPGSSLFVLVGYWPPQKMQAEFVLSYLPFLACTETLLERIREALKEICDSQLGINEDKPKR